MRTVRLVIALCLGGHTACSNPPAPDYMADMSKFPISYQPPAPRVTPASMPAPAAAGRQSLQGQWRIAAETQPTYVGIVLIDQSGRTTWDSPLDSGRPASFRGYVSRLDHPRAELTFTNGIGVARAHCLIQSAELMHCHNVRADGSTSDVFTLTRVGPGPANLLTAR